MPFAYPNSPWLFGLVFLFPFIFLSFSLCPFTYVRRFLPFPPSPFVFFIHRSIPPGLPSIYGLAWGLLLLSITIITSSSATECFFFPSVFNSMPLISSCVLALRGPEHDLPPLRNSVPPSCASEHCSQLAVQNGHGAQVTIYHLGLRRRN